MRSVRLILWICAPLIAITTVSVLAQPPGGGLQARVRALEAENAAMQLRLDALEERLVHIRRDGDDLFIEGANVFVVNGTGATSTTNGLGNLMIGYNRPRPGVVNRTGSHNLIVGSEHNFSSFGGVAFGIRNTVSGEFASVTGGFNNTASGNSSSVTGGSTNESSGAISWVGGGGGNVSSGEAASISGGNFGIASELAASITAGFRNEANGQFTSVTGGQLNRAEADLSSISGGHSFVVTTTGEHVNTHP